MTRYIIKIARDKSELFYKHNKLIINKLIAIEKFYCKCDILLFLFVILNVATGLCDGCEVKNLYAT